MSKQKSLVPPLRFPEFRDAGPWEVKRLGEIAAKRAERNKKEHITRVLTNSAEKGIVDQKAYFKKDIAVQGNLDNYFVVYKGDFVYNPRISISAPVGPISRNNIGKGVMSPLYTVFFFYESETDFYYYYFGSSAWHSYMRSVGSTGARHDRMAISNEDFFNMPIPVPSKQEQQKIADCLSSLDELIQAEEKALEALKQHKKGLMQQLFPAPGETTPKLRFPEFRDAGPWEVKRLGEICFVLQGYGFPESLQGKQQGKYPFCKVSDITNAVDNAGGHIDEAANYVDEDEVRELRAKPVPKGTTIFAKIGEALRLNKRAYVEKECLIDNNVVGLKAKHEQAIDSFIFYLSQKIDLNKYCGGAVPSVSKSSLQSIKVVIPSLLEQQKIVDCLSSLDELILAKSQRIDALKLHKKGLMQKLFPSLDKVRG